MNGNRRRRPTVAQPLRCRGRREYVPDSHYHIGRAARQYPRSIREKEEMTCLPLSVCHTTLLIRAVRRGFACGRAGIPQSYAGRFSGARRVESKRDVCCIECEREAALVQSSMDDAFARLSVEARVGR